MKMFNKNDFNFFNYIILCEFCLTGVNMLLNDLSYETEVKEKETHSDFCMCVNIYDLALVIVV